jgi:hypothetical protein
MTMDPRVASVVSSLTVALSLLSLGCGDAGGSKARPAATSAPAAAAPPRTPFVPVDACSLLTKAEVEALVGTPAMEPTKEQAANLVTCAFGDPESPRVGDRPLTQVLTLAVFTAEEAAYYAGAVAQARDSYETARKNAASSEAVAGLGENAYWDKVFKTLHAHKGRYWITAKAGGLEAARKAVEKAIEGLP